MITLVLLEDKGQKKGQHEEKNLFWRELGIEVVQVPLPVGDYILADNKVMDVIFRKDKRGIPLKKMDFLGTYAVCVDTKKDIQELVGNVCGKQHERFRDECILAQNNGIKLYVLVQNVGGIVKNTKTVYNPTVTNLEELGTWQNPRLFEMKNSNEVIGRWKNGKPRYKRIQRYPSATKGETLMKACKTMQEKYGVEFVFCHNSEQGAKVLELLGAEV